MKISKILKAAAIGVVGMHALKTFHTKRYTSPGYSIKPAGTSDFAPAELNKPIPKKKPGANPLTVTFVYAGDHMGTMIFKWDYLWITPKEKLIYNRNDIISWLKDRILSNSDKKSKYIVIKKLDNRTITFAFDHNTWFKDTLKKAKATIGYIPNKVFIKWTVPIPDLPMTKYSRAFLTTFLCRNLNNYFRKNRSAMKFQKYYKWLDKVNPDFFRYNVDWFKLEWILTLKNTVILGTLALAFGVKKALKP